MTILAIESTCDETGASVARPSPDAAIGAMAERSVEILSDVKASSAEILSRYGGVVPEVAAREQVAAIIPVIEEAMKKAGVQSKDLEAVAVTQGPGLIGSLLIGIETAKTLSLAWKKPLIKVNHMAAHVFANWIVDGDQVPELPAIALIVSGGHTDLMYMENTMKWQWVGGTRDDAAGEAFDKTARAMGLPYPGGPEIARMARTADNMAEIAQSKKLPRPMIDDKTLEMSFSGLKTAVVQQIANGGWLMDNETDRALLAREFDQAVTEVLVKKTMLAVEKYRPKSVLLAGGVAANALLRKSLEASCQKVGIRLFVPDLKYCTDNAAMIAACALMRPEYVDPTKLRPEPGLEIV